MNILTFYNAIANDGVMVRPKFVKALMRDGKVIKKYPTEVINPKICSDSTLAQIRTILRSVVKNGLAKPAGNDQFAVSGKTGTAQISKGKAGYKTGRTDYLVSFCGYFPSEAPQYSCIVSIQKPGLPASGGLMAGSVFGNIAKRVFAQDLRFDLNSHRQHGQSDSRSKNRRTGRNSGGAGNFESTLRRTYCLDKRERSMGHLARRLFRRATGRTGT